MGRSASVWGAGSNSQAVTRRRRSQRERQIRESVVGERGMRARARSKSVSVSYIVASKSNQGVAVGEPRMTSGRTGMQVV